ncbi:MAG: hypothetical protein FWE06_00125 [Oscillospiraceae bacterium]|nr:hypothetical protein [Oscillospiraceae bacterium]
MEMISSAPKMSKFEQYITNLPVEVQNEARKTDEFLMKDMKNSLNIKRTVNDFGIRYVSALGFIYKMRRLNFEELHDMEIPKINEKNGTIETLSKLAETSPEFADKMFSNLPGNIAGRICNNCTIPSGGNGCRHAIKYEYNDKIKISCGGLQFQWTPSDFQDARKVIEAVSKLLSAEV